LPRSAKNSVQIAVVKNQVQTFRLFLKLKVQTGTTILAVGIKYSVRDLICD